MTTGRPPPFELRRASIERSCGPVLAAVDWTVADRAVTVVLGPGGVGKSLLLRALAGAALPDGFRRTGSWSYRGLPLSERRTPGDNGDAGGFSARSHEVVWWPQRARATGSGAGADTQDWRAGLDGTPDALLLDEPGTGSGTEDRRALARALRRKAEGCAVVVVTHDLTFARDVADHICLLVAGRIEASGPATSFWEAPPSELARRFVRQGNCWLPGPSAPELPNHFHWLLPGKLAGMGRPGLLRHEELDLEAIAAAGVELLVSLTRRALPLERLRSYGIRGRHFPIEDMGVPAVAPTARLCREIERALERGETVAVHCHAGLGRTGAVLAAYLTWTGMPAAQAIGAVREICASYIQSDAQLAFIERFAAQV